MRNTLNKENIRTKNDLVDLLFVFHNMVNKRKNLKPFKYENLEYYKTRNIVETYNAFSRNFHTHGNMNLINESFHRTRLLGQLRVWLMNGLSHFDL